jgi:site-specific recombinase XerD
MENSALFLNRFGEPLRNRGVQKMLGKYLKKAGLEKVSIHSIRHTFGVYQVSMGTSLRTIQNVMGHKDIRSTSLYISLAEV